MAEPSMSVPLTDDALPAVFRRADATAASAQTLARYATAAQLSLYVLAAIAGAWPTRWGAALAVLFFLGAVGCSLYLATSDPDRTWYLARGGAEAVKSLAWLYATGGEPFPIGAPPRDVDRLYEQALHGVFDDLSDLDWRLDQDETPNAITDPMRSLRASDLSRRRTAYEAQRLKDQHRYYTQKSSQYHKLNARWTSVALIVSFVGLGLGVVRIVTEYDIDLLALAAVGAASATAWTEARQFKPQATSYIATANELEALSINLPYVESEKEWASFVRDAERTVDREHSLWLTRHGLRPGSDS
jgi:hypothetical protein